MNDEPRQSSQLDGWKDDFSLKLFACTVDCCLSRSSCLYFLFLEGQLMFLELSF